MDIGDVISDSMRYPSSDWSKVLVLGLLLLLSFLIIPLFLAGGYIFRVIEASLAGIEELPAFDEWGEMFIDGIKLFVVYLVYSLPAIIISIFSLISMWYSIISLNHITQLSGTVLTPDMFFSIFGGTALVGLMIAGVYSLVIYPILAVAVGNIAYYNGEIGAAFRFSQIIDIISRIGWIDMIIWYVVVILVGFVVIFIGSIIGIIPILGWIILIFLIYPYIYLFYARAVAWLYSSAFDPEYEA